MKKETKCKNCGAQLSKSGPCPECGLLHVSKRRKTAWFLLILLPACFFIITTALGAVKKFGMPPRETACARLFEHADTARYRIAAESEPPQKSAEEVLCDFAVSKFISGATLSEIYKKYPRSLPKHLKKHGFKIIKLHPELI